MKDPIYISGPMTGYDNQNFESFIRAAKALRGMGFTVLSPHEAKVEAPSHEEYMRADIAMLLQCNSVVTLPNWFCSKGARLEVEIAHMLGMTVLPVEKVLRGDNKWA